MISPAALASVRPDPARSADRLSARWLLALAARLVQEVGTLVTGAARAGKPVATYGLDTEVRFAGAADRAAFAEELTNAVAALVAKYHTEGAERGRDHRVIVAIHPSLSQPNTAGTSQSPEPTQSLESAQSSAEDRNNKNDEES